jgi:hypothetical protein
VQTCCPINRMDDPMTAILADVSRKIFCRFVSKSALDAITLLPACGIIAACAATTS